MRAGQIQMVMCSSTLRLKHWQKFSTKQMTVKTALAVLEKQELIFRKRQGPGHPNRIYVKIPKETLSNTDRILSSRQTENCPIDRQDSFPDTDRKLSSNKKEIKKEPFNNKRE